MPNEAYSLTREALIAETRRLGYPVTPAQLRRWCDLDLLPRPKRKGLGRGRGVAVLYHPIAAWQAYALKRALEARRNLDDAGWVLWVLGFPVEAFIRPFLNDYLIRVEREAKALVKAVSQDKSRKRIVRLATKEATRAKRGLYRVVAPASIPTVLKMGAEFRLGTINEQSYSENDWQLFQEGLLSAVFPDQPELLDDPDLPKPTEVERGIRELSRHIPYSEIRAALQHQDNRTLAMLRSEAQGLKALVASTHGLGDEPITPDDFIYYLGQVVVHPEGAAHRKAVYDEMGWKRPPYTFVETLIRKKFQAHSGGTSATDK
jgi:hypothetical protein